jgi:hypothetical protein
LERLRVVRAVVTDGAILGRRDIEDCGTDHGAHLLQARSGLPVGVAILGG